MKSEQWSVNITLTFLYYFSHETYSFKFVVPSLVSARMTRSTELEDVILFAWLDKISESCFRNNTPRCSFPQAIYAGKVTKQIRLRLSMTIICFKCFEGAT